MNTSTPEVEGGQNTRPQTRPSRIQVATACIVAAGLGIGVYSNISSNKAKRNKPASTETVRKAVVYFRSLPEAERIACPSGANPPKFVDGRRLCFSLLEVRFESVPESSSARAVVPLTSERTEGFLRADMAATIADNPNVPCEGPREALRESIQTRFENIPGLAPNEYVPFRIVFDSNQPTRCDDPGSKPAEVIGVR